MLLISVMVCIDSARMRSVEETASLILERMPAALVKTVCVNPASRSFKAGSACKAVTPMVTGCPRNEFSYAAAYSLAICSPNCAAVMPDSSCSAVMMGV